MRPRFLLLFVFLLMPAVLFAAGKIKGKVADKENGEALVGANVSIEGTTMGAATDVNGEYTIVDLPAGLYTVKATYVGYGAVTVTNVRVNNDLTTSLNFTLSSEAVALQGVEIVAQRPLVNKNATNAVRITTAEDIASLPVRGINSVLALSPGVVLQDNTVFIRGGRQDEVGFYLEGVPITNPLFGGRAVTLVQDAVEEIQVQAGGYNAEFGGANSGIIQQQLKTGTTDWKASVQYASDNIGLKSKSKNFDGQKVLGAYHWGYTEGTATLSGPIASDRFKLFGLFNYLFHRDVTEQPYPGINLGPIGDPVSRDTINFTYPAGPTQGNSFQQYTGTGTFTMDFRPVTVRFTGTYTGTTSYVPYNTDRVAGVIANFLDVARTEQQINNDGAFGVKVTHLLSPTTFYEVNAGYFFNTQKNWDPILQDNFLGYGDSVANAQAGVFWTRGPGDPVGRFTREVRPQIFTFAFNAPGDVMAGYVKRKQENVVLSGAINTQLGKEHSLKAGLEYERYAIRNYSFGNEGVFALSGLVFANDTTTDPTKKQTAKQIYQGRGVNNYGYDVFGNDLGGGIFSSSDPKDFEAAKHPVFWAAYVQDKIEYRDLVINAGLRFDYINTDNFAFVDPARPDLAIDPNTLTINPDGLRKVSSFKAVSPRLGLSFPVTDQTVFHTQFGKFVQQTRLRDIYQGLFLTASNIKGGFFIPQPVGFDVRPTRTTQYEIGFSQQVSDFASIDITGYYKDITDQVVYDQQFTTPGSPLPAYYILKNGDFATTKGIELTFNMRRQKRLQINSFLAFQDARGTGSFPNSNRGIVGAPLDGVTVFRPEYISPLEFNNAVRGDLTLDYRFGKGDGGPILEQLGASVLFTFNSGHPFTLGIGGANLEGDARDRQPVEPLNSSTTPWVFQVDLRVDKSFPLGNALQANVFLYVINVFDTRNIQNVFLRTGSTTDDGYISNPTQGGKIVQTFGPEYAALYKAINIDYYEQYQASLGNLSTTSYFWGPPRQVRLGIRLEY